LLGWRAGLHEFTWFVADGLAMGSWLAMYIRRPDFSRRGLTRVAVGALGVALLAALAGTPFGILTRERLLGAAFQASCGNLAFLGLLGSVLLLGTGPRKFMVQWPILRFYGDISYGLYLIHLLVFEFYDGLIARFWSQLPSRSGHFGIMTMRFAVAGLAATGLAFLSRRYFEGPFLRLKTRFTPSTSANGHPPSYLPRTGT
jgi:peptidoglycan/LPS O-acetylase OafA/YrhL